MIAIVAVVTVFIVMPAPLAVVIVAPVVSPP